ncbi:MAG: hypothetical protein A4E57_02819 [Syntrophorhabdaceae bacterium PtaU1.Bin034]|jgi:hypothetical protein|nr:MAG: hypothetical protein A4E57_02819 [Syntrophorhabdaceae bacterium PtaU1.Bin034]
MPVADRARIARCSIERGKTIAYPAINVTSLTPAHGVPEKTALTGLPSRHIDNHKGWH